MCQLIFVIFIKLEIIDVFYSPLGAVQSGQPREMKNKDTKTTIREHTQFFFKSFLT